MLSTLPIHEFSTVEKDDETGTFDNQESHSIACSKELYEKDFGIRHVGYRQRGFSDAAAFSL